MTCRVRDLYMIHRVRDIQWLIALVTRRLAGVCQRQRCRGAAVCRLRNLCMSRKVGHLYTWLVKLVIFTRLKDFVLFTDSLRSWLAGLCQQPRCCGAAGGARGAGSISMCLCVCVSLCVCMCVCVCVCVCMCVCVVCVCAFAYVCVRRVLIIQDWL